MKNLYFDHAATSPMHPEVIEKMLDIMQNNFGNPSSVHGFGRRAHKELMTARSTIAASLNARPHEIIFNSGGTEGDNTAIIETALHQKNLGLGKHIITTAVEHPAVLEPMKYLESLGFEVTYLPVNRHGQLEMSTFLKALRDDTILVSVMYVNNETGNIFPIKEIGEALRDHQAVFHTDAVQAYGALTIDVDDVGVDLLSISAHKFNGPKGVGFLYKRDGINFASLLRGGEQEEKRRAGTENLAGICGMAKAVEILTPAEKTRRKNYLARLTQIICDELMAANIDFSINGDVERKVPNVFNLHFKGISSELLLTRLDLAGIAVSSGSACTAGNIEPSHVLEAMYGKNDAAIDESLRISLGYENSEDDVRVLAQQLIKEIKRFTKKD